MADVAISPTGPNEYRVAVRQQPTYLVAMEKGATGKTIKQFIATKMDVGTGNFAKFIGFYVDANEDDIATNYQELVAKADAEAFVEILVPYSRVATIRSLSYRHKKQQ